MILEQLAPYQAEIKGLVVASTSNWYWLVDGLMDADDRVHLANPAAMQPYSGLKHTDDRSDARWLAHMLRRGVLPEGSISPRAERAVRDVLRKRAHLVHQHTSNVLSVQNILVRNSGKRFGVKQIHNLHKTDLEALLSDASQVLAVISSVKLLECLRQQITTLEQAVRKHLKHPPASEQLVRVKGIGEILAHTIILATGPVGRFPGVGNSASYCRGVSSTKRSHGKRKGQGHVKHGTPSLAWASREAAQVAIRFRPKIQRFSQRQASKHHVMVARNTGAHQLARACYDVMRDLVPFDVERACGCG
jgi:transposase